MIYKAFDKQIQFHKSQARQRLVMAGKRGGKTECGAIEALIHTETRPGWTPNGVDPYLGVIIAPTSDMMRRLSLAKFFGYAQSFKYDYNKSVHEITWHNGSKIYAISGERPKRLEGLRAHWIWADEVTQLDEQLYLEMLARVSDTKGRIWLTGSLGVSYNNPKQHWIYRLIKERQQPGIEVFEWSTAENPYFPKDELERLQDSLDPRSYRQMFTIDWNTAPTNLVYENFDEGNQQPHKYDPNLETSVSIDWGWSHECACLFFQTDGERVYLFDEIVSSKLLLDDLWNRIKSKGYHINNWYCDAAGLQTREQSGKSNIHWFREQPREVHFKFKRISVSEGIAVVRSFIQNALGQKRFFIDPKMCPKSLDGILNYRYQQKNGIMTEEVFKERDDACDAIRYYFINRHPLIKPSPGISTFNRWGQWQY